MLSWTRNTLNYEEIKILFLGHLKDIVGAEGLWSSKFGDCYYPYYYVLKSLYIE